MSCEELDFGMIDWLRERYQDITGTNRRPRCCRTRQLPIAGKNQGCLRAYVDIQLVRYIFMQVSKWGNSLAVRLPAAVVDALNLKEGDEIEISVASKRDFKVTRDRSKERALEQLRQMKWSFPPDFKFNREEINER
jgi:antitoxin MazE